MKYLVFNTGTKSQAVELQTVIECTDMIEAKKECKRLEKLAGYKLMVHAGTSINVKLAIHHGWLPVNFDINKSISNNPVVNSKS